MNKDLTVGKPSTVLLKFCLPLLGSVVFQQLYNLADSFVAGKFIGNNALAAVGNSYEITLVFLAIASGCNIGCSIIVAQLFGAKRLKELKTAVYTSLISCGVICLLLMSLGLIFCGTLLKLIDTPQEIFADSKEYLDIYILGLPFMFFYNVSNGIFSALGDSKTPFWFLVCSSVTNIGMDILFVAKFNMGVAGVAWATFICQGVSCILAVIFVLVRFYKIKVGVKVPLFSFELLKEIAIIAVPSMLQQSFISVGNIIIQRVINGFGPAVIAGYASAIKLNNMAVTTLFTVGNGMSNFTAQNLGAKKYGRIREGFASGAKAVLAISFPIVLLYFFLGNKLVYMFLESPTGEAVDVGTICLKIIAPFYLIICLKIISDGVLRGSGKMKQFMAGTFTDLIIRVILSVILAQTPLKSTGIWISWPIGWVISTAMSLIFYRKIYGKYEKESD